MLKVRSGPVLVRSYEVPGAGRTGPVVQGPGSRTEFKDRVQGPGPCPGLVQSWLSGHRRPNLFMLTLSIVYQAEILP